MRQVRTGWFKKPYLWPVFNVTILSEDEDSYYCEIHGTHSTFAWILKNQLLVKDSYKHDHIQSLENARRELHRNIDNWFKQDHRLKKYLPLIEEMKDHSLACITSMVYSQGFSGMRYFELRKAIFTELQHIDSKRHLKP